MAIITAEECATTLSGRSLQQAASHQPGRPTGDEPTGHAPLVSVVIPVFNQGEFVAGAIDSVLAQGYVPIEIVVVDDGSTDDTPTILAGYQRALRVIRQPNRGAASALNEGIRATSGPLVCWLSADDLFLAGKVEAQVAAFLRTPSLGLVHTGFEEVDAAGELIRTVEHPTAVHPDAFVSVFWRNSINGSTVMLRREVFDACGGFNESLRADVDADMWLRIALHWPLVSIPGVYVRYRVHGNSLSANTRLMISSITEVRKRNLAELRRRISGRTIPPAVLLARMSADWATQGLEGLAATLLAASLRSGWAPRRQVTALAALGFTRARRSPTIRFAGRPLWRGLRWLRSRGA